MDPDWDELARRSERIRLEAAALGPVTHADVTAAIGEIVDQELDALARVELLHYRMMPSPGVAHGVGLLRRRTMLLIRHHADLVRRRRRWWWLPSASIRKPSHP